MRNTSIDILKLTLSFFVVFIHMKLLANISPTVSFFLVNGLFRIAVPVFLVINGYYFASVKNFHDYKRFALNLFSIYGLWMGVYSVYWFSKEPLLANLVYVFFGYYHLWYIVGLIFSSFFLFIIRGWKSYWLLLMSFSLYILGVSLQYILSVKNISGNWGGTTINYLYLYRNFLFDCLPFLILGFTIKHCESKITISKCTLFFFAVILLFVLYGEVYLNYNYISSFSPLDMSFTMFLLAPVVFIFTKNIVFELDSKNISDFASAVFFVHLLGLRIVEKTEKVLSIDNELLHFCLSIIMVVILASGLVFLKNKWANRFRII